MSKFLDFSYHYSIFVISDVFWEDKKFLLKKCKKFNKNKIQINNNIIDI